MDAQGMEIDGNDIEPCTGGVAPVHLFYCNIYKEMVHPLLQETDFEKGVSHAENNVNIGTF